eukprot:9494868-Pyramimonas_sp.AAC.1
MAVDVRRGPIRERVRARKSWQRSTARYTTVRCTLRVALTDARSMRRVARQVANEVKQDIRIHDAVPPLQYVKMPAITANEHCRQLRERARAVLRARPPKGPSPPVVDL